MQPAFALSMQANCVTHANPLARTPITVQKKVARDSMIGGIVEFPSSKILAAHGFARLFVDKRLNPKADNSGFTENFQTIITFPRDPFIDTVMQLMKENPDIPFYRFENGKVEFFFISTLLMNFLHVCGFRLF